MAHLRQFKRRMALLVALADVGQVWTTDACLEAMSLTADATLKAATDFLFRKAREAGQVTAGDGMSEPRGYFIIAMGKLGAMELNYSSDIDFMVFYDAARARLASDVEPSTFFVKLTRSSYACCRSTPPTVMCSAPISGSGPIQARRRSRSTRRRPHLLRELRPELGARGADQGAHRRGRRAGRRGVPAPVGTLRLAQISRLRRSRRHPRHETAGARA